MLLTGSRDELCGLLPALFQTALITSSLSALLPFQSLFAESSHEISSLPLAPSLVYLQHLAPSAACSFSVVYYSVFVVVVVVVLQGKRLICPGAMLFYPRGGCGNTT
jgi:hypothetical protein